MGRLAFRLLCAAPLLALAAARCPAGEGPGGGLFDGFAETRSQAAAGTQVTFSDGRAGAGGLFAETSGEDMLAPHLWLDPHGEGLGGRVALGVSHYDNDKFHESVGYEIELRLRVVGTWGLGLLVGQSLGGMSATGALADGVLFTGISLLTTNVDIPLGSGRAPVLSLGGGVGFMYVHPDQHFLGDWESDRLSLEQSVSSFMDTRVRADLCFPGGPPRGIYVAIGVARDWASGDVRSRLVDRETGETVARASSHHRFDRTTLQLALVFAF